MTAHDAFEVERTPIPSGVLGMAIFLATEAMFFAGLISAFWVLRAQTPLWPPPDQPRLPVALTGANTLVLLASGWTAHLAVRARRRGRAAGPWLDATALLGLVFLGVQGTEWVRLLGYGLTTSSSLYGATFYTLVGAHALHVVAALVVLLVIRGGGGRAGPQLERLELTRVYWLFVVAVWPVLYVLVYLT